MPLARRAGAGAGGPQAKPQSQPAARQSKREQGGDTSATSHHSDRAVAYQSSQGETVAGAGNEPQVVPGHTPDLPNPRAEQLHWGVTNTTRIALLSKSCYQPTQQKGTNPLTGLPCSS